MVHIFIIQINPQLSNPCAFLSFANQGFYTSSSEGHHSFSLGVNLLSREGNSQTGHRMPLATHGLLF